MMSRSRTALSAETRRESRHRCARPTCRSAGKL